MEEIFAAVSPASWLGIKTDLTTMFIAVLTMLLLIKGLELVLKGMDTATYKDWSEKRRLDKVRNYKDSGETSKLRLVKDYDSLH